MQSSAICGKCGQEKPAQEFAKNARRKTGLSFWCKACASAHSKEKRRLKGQKPATISYERDGLKYCVQCEQWLPCTSEYFYWHSGNGKLRPRCIACVKQERKDNPEKYKLAGAIYYQKNAEHIKSRNQEYRKKNPEKVLRMAQRWAEAHPEKVKAYSRKFSKSTKGRIKRIRRRTKQAQLRDDFTANDWAYALTYFEGRCAVCGRPPGLWHFIAADHWIPVSSEHCPGTIPANMIPLCHGSDGCNNSKNDKDPLEWLLRTYGKRKGRAIYQRIMSFFKSVRPLSEE